MNQLELTRSFRVGELSIANFLSQIEIFFDKHEPSVLAFISETNRFERLRMEAEELVARYPDPQKRPPLFGMLFGVKDIFHADGFVTHAGSKLPAEGLQGSEAVSVTRLKNAGALVLGKTVTTEFAYFFLVPRATRTTPIIPRAARAAVRRQRLVQVFALLRLVHRPSARSSVPLRFAAWSRSSLRTNAFPATVSFPFRLRSIT